MKTRDFINIIGAVMIGVTLVMLILFIVQNSFGGSSVPCTATWPNANMILDCQATRTAEGK